MIGTGDLLSITYILLIYAFAFTIMYPIFREVCQEIFNSNGAGEAVAFFIALAAMAYGFYIGFYLIHFFIGGMLVLLSMISGFELIFLSRSFKIVNIALFIVSLTLSVWSPIIQRITQIAYLIKGIIYLVGVGEGAGKHLFPLIREAYGFNDEYAGAFVALFMAICILAVFFPLLSAELPPYLHLAQDLSDVCFAVGGLIGYLMLWAYKKGGLMF